MSVTVMAIPGTPPSRDPSIRSSPRLRSLKPLSHDDNDQPSPSPQPAGINWEWSRKAFHSSQGLFVCLLYHYFPWLSCPSVLRILLPLFLAFMYIDHLRLEDPNLNTQFCRILGRTMRKDELHAKRMTSSSAFMTGVLLVLAVWFDDKEICLLSILFLSWVDTAAAFGGRIGTMVGREMFGMSFRPISLPLTISVDPKTGIGLRESGKSIFGFLSASFCGFIVYYGFRAYHSLPFDLLRCGLAGLIGGVAEGLTIDGVDDDCSLPVFSALLFYILKDVLF